LLKLPHGCRKNFQSEPSSALTWRNNPQSPIYDLKYRQLKFVNRDESIRLLKEIHQDAFYHARLSGGAALRIPLIDNLEGMGKSQFAAHYISKCAELFEKDDSPFENSLRRARTIIIKLSKGSLIAGCDGPDNLQTNIEKWESVLKTKFCDAVAELKKAESISGDDSVLSSFQTSYIEGASESAIKKFISDTNTPLFLVLDGIGLAFTDGAFSEEEQANLFQSFCEYVLERWLNLNDLFFLLIGSGGFLRTVSCPRPGFFYCGSTTKLLRISLKMIRRKTISEILMHTYRKNSEGRSVSLMDFFGITKKNKKRVIDALLEATNGHPGSMRDLLYANATIEKLEEACNNFGIAEIRERRTDLVRFHGTLEELIDNVSIYPDEAHRKTYDLTRKVYENDLLIYCELLNRSLIRWEGTIDAARLLAPKNVLAELKTIVRPR
jgi:hypothetical protein